MVNNTLSDLYVRIKNGYSLKLEEVLVLRSKLVVKVLDILLLEGFIRGYSFNVKDFNKIKVLLKYSASGKKAIREIKGVSGSSRRLYASVDVLWSFYSESDTTCLILSTSKGVIDLKTALKLNIGGELLCLVR